MQIRELAALQLCQVSSQEAEVMRLSSGSGMWRSSAAWQAPGGSFISSTCALVLRGTDEIYRSKSAFYKIYYTTKHLVKNKLLLRNYGDSSNGPYPESQHFIFFIEFPTYKRRNEMFLGCSESQRGNQSFIHPQETPSGLESNPECPHICNAQNNMSTVVPPLTSDINFSPACL